jgi:hypothetical protein
MDPEQAERITVIEHVETRRYVVVVEFSVPDIWPLDALPPELNTEADNDLGEAVQDMGGTLIAAWAAGHKP